MKRNFIKTLPLIVLCSFGLGVTTSCDKDDDKKETVSAVEQAREDGKTFGAAAAKVKNVKSLEASDIPAIINALSLANKYKNTDDNVYKTAFAEGAAETGLLGDSTKGDSAVNALNNFLNNLENAKNLLGQQQSDGEEQGD